jgi:hypothetical protein
MQHLTLVPTLAAATVCERDRANETSQSTVKGIQLIVQAMNNFKGHAQNMIGMWWSHTTPYVQAQTLGKCQNDHITSP